MATKDPSGGGLKSSAEDKQIDEGQCQALATSSSAASSASNPTTQQPAIKMKIKRPDMSDIKMSSSPVKVESDQIRLNYEQILFMNRDQIWQNSQSPDFTEL